MDPIISPGTNLSQPSKYLRFDGKVAIVTGAGHGLGKAYSLLLASRGCKVLVNDLGGSVSGDGSSTRAADQVVDIIRSAGGEAAPSYASVVDGEKVVQDALTAFGRIDIVINNAGILRDGSFQKMSDKQWDLVLAVHLQGAFAVTKAAWPYMRKQRYGRVIFVCSSTGLYGNFGQANYGAAKMGTLGLAHTLALEGRRRGILVNTVAPIAASRMTEGLMPPGLMRALSPEAVAPVVAVLAHDQCPCDDACVEVGAGWVAAVRWQRSKGERVPLDQSKDLPAGSGSVEAVAKAWEAAMDFDVPGASHPSSTQESFEPLLAAMGANRDGGAGSREDEEGMAEGAEEAAMGGGDSEEEGGSSSTAWDSNRDGHPSVGVARECTKQFAALTAGNCPGLCPLPGGILGSNDSIDVPRAIAAPLPSSRSQYDWKHSALYALAVGVSRDPLDAKDLAYVYENADTEETSPGAGLAAPLVMPTQAVLFPHAALEALVAHPGLEFNPMMLLHGEQELVLPIDATTGLARPLPSEARVEVRNRISRVFDKGSGALVVADSLAADISTGLVLAVNRASIFLRGVGGFTGSTKPPGVAGASGQQPWELPGGMRPAARLPTAQLDTAIRPEGALIYRLLGDLNPLHADPAVSGAAGFEQPILHGLCSLGVAGRSLIRELAGGDPRRLLRIRGRFSKHVLPGQTLRTRMWIAGYAAPAPAPVGEEAASVLFPTDHGAAARGGVPATRVLFEVISFQSNQGSKASGGEGVRGVTVLSRGEALVVLPRGGAKL